MSRLSRKQIKRNEMAETVGSVVDYTRDHTRTLIWGAVAVVAVAALVAGFFFWRGQQASRAAAALGSAMEAAEQGGAAQDRFQEILDRYPGSAAADVARLYLAEQAAAETQDERAQELWRAVARDGVDNALGQQALLNVWELERARGRHAEVADEIRALLDAERQAPPKDRLLYELGLTLEAAGDDLEAHDVYLRLIDEHPQSVLRGVAQERADRLGGDTAG